jgi:hypothetical protein
VNPFALTMLAIVVGLLVALLLLGRLRLPDVPR